MNDAEKWDERYRKANRVFSGRPNVALVDLVGGLPPGLALDVGAGEGADAGWLAEHGWKVTAVDISTVALERARTSFPSSAIDWVLSDLAGAGVPEGPFDLVSLAYFPLARTDESAIRKLIGAVALGGRLLVVGHEPNAAAKHGHLNPQDYWQPAEVAALLGDDWVIEFQGTRPRPPAGESGQYVEDVVVLARRTGP